MSPDIVLFTIYKNGNITRAWPTLKSNSTSFWSSIFFLGSIIKSYEKGGQGGTLKFF